MKDKLYSPTIKADCFLWPGKLSKAGYGLTPEHKLAHRVVWAAFNGPIPKGLWIDHTCRNRSCVLLKHLRAVDPKVNCLENNDNPAARNARKTECTNGHPFDKANTYFAPQGNSVRRYCRKCKNKRANAAHAKRRAIV